jgi:hypothetical protein
MARNTTLNTTIVTCSLASLALFSLAPSFANAADKDGKSATASASVSKSAPQVLQAKRPKGGEWMGLYLAGKKAGWAFSDLDETTWEGQKVVRATNEVLLSATIGGAKSERKMREERYYEPKEGGALLGFHIERTGDGGNETQIGHRKKDQFELNIDRPGHAPETRTLPASQEIIDQADPARVALLRHAKVAGPALDEDELADKNSSTEPLPDDEVVYGGVHVKVHRTLTIEEKDNLKVISSFDDKGELVEVSFGQPPVMVGKAEPEATAKKLDEVDLFALTRVSLDAAPAKSAFAVPGQLVMHVRGLPPEFQKPNPRQTYATQPGGIVDVSIKTHAPTRSATRPESPADDEQKEALKSTMQVESSDPQIVALSKKIVGGEKDAWTASQKLSEWVHDNLQKAYGASSDRATDVLLRMKGDCTEHALLFTALARAAGIPARRVDGLVYMDTSKNQNEPTLYWHEWSQVYVGEWIDIDPTFGQPVADATHLALGSEGKADSAALIGQLAITVK